MNRSEKILTENHDLIKRFVDLAICQDAVYDSRHRWFYGLIPAETISPILYMISAEDIEAQICVYVLEQLHKNKSSDEEFSSYLKKSIGWYLRDYLLDLAKQQRVTKEYAASAPVKTNPVECIYNIDLRWVIADCTAPLSDYEKYILYLYLYKCYTINQIALILYQERTTIRKSLHEARDKFRSYYETAYSTSYPERLS